MKEKGSTPLFLLMKRPYEAERAGFSFVEMMIVLLIFTFLFAAIFTVLTASDRSWRIGQDKLTQQQEARKAMSQIIRLLRQSNPEWTDESGSSYPVSITAGNRIDFYIPSFTPEGEVAAFRKVTFKLNPDNPRQLLKKIGTAASVVVAQEIEGLDFGGGCPGCSAFNCSTVADDCPRVEIEVRTSRGDIADYVLNSSVTLRNINVVIPEEVGVEEPGEGEF